MDNSKLLAAAILLGMQDKFAGTEHEDYMDNMTNWLIDLLNLYEEIAIVDGALAEVLERPKKANSNE